MGDVLSWTILVWRSVVFSRPMWRERTVTHCSGELSVIATACGGCRHGRRQIRHDMHVDLFRVRSVDVGCSA